MMPSPKNSMILLSGVTGYIGGRLASRLKEQGYRIRCLVRRRETLAGQPWIGEGVEVIAGDVLDPESLKKAFERVDTAYYLVHSMAAGEGGFEERDRRGATNFAAAARSAGISRIIYLGGLGGEAATPLSPHLKSRQEVGNILRSTGVPVTEFRAAIIVGSGSLSFELLRYLTERLPVMICPRWINSLCQPIAIRDVLRYLLSAVEEPRSAGKVLEIGGADILSFGDMMRRYARIRGLRRWLIRVPVLTPRLSSYWVDLIAPIPASLARPLIQGLKNDVICHSDEARRLFGFSPIGYDEAVRLALERVAQGQIETIWSGSQSSIPYLRGQTEVLAPQFENREGMLIETHQIEIDTPPDHVFRTLCEIGGERGWYYADIIWQLRGVIDRILGGIGMRRGRRHPTELAAGEVLDFWRVEELIPRERIRLRAEMKLPGKAWLQFEVQRGRKDKSCLLTIIAYFEPRGLWGLLYWYGFYPIHRLIFPGLIRRVKKRCEGSEPES